MMKLRKGDEKDHCFAEWYVTTEDPLAVISADLIANINGDGNAQLISVLMTEGNAGLGQEKKFHDAMKDLWGAPAETAGSGVADFLLAARRNEKH